MGGFMVCNLLKYNQYVMVFDLMLEVVDVLVEVGVYKVGLFQEVVVGVDVVVIMLFVVVYVKLFYLGEYGLLVYVDKSVLLIDCSIIDV